MEIEGLGYSELSTHFGVAYLLVASNVEVDLFAGPSFFDVETELLDIGSVESEYPFDEISLVSVSRVTANKSALGFHAGAAFAYYMTESFGFSFVARFSKAGIEVMREGGEPIAINAGGFRLGGGIRIRF